MKTKVILNQNVERLGRVGAVVNVSLGFARNFLLPYGMARPATEANVRLVERTKREEIKNEKEKEAQGEVLAEKIRALSVTIEARAGEDGKLFGSVTSADIADALGAEKLEVDKKDIRLKTPLRKLGSYQVDIHCYSHLKAGLKLKVVKKKE